MDTGRQIIRWSIPGTVFLACFLASQIVFISINNPSLIGSLFGAKDTAEYAIPYVLLISAIIPLGFIIYQIYYWSYGNVLALLHFVAIDKGAIILGHMKPETLRRIFENQTSRTFSHIERNVVPLTVGQFDVKEPDHYSYIVDLKWLQKLLPQFRKLKSEYRNSAGRREYRLHFFGHWDMVRSWLQARDDERLRTEYTNHFDIFHSLGACSVAILLATLSSLTSLFFLTDLGSKIVAEPGTTLPNLAAFAILIAMALLLLKILDSNRRASLYSILALLMHEIARSENEPSQSDQKTLD